MNDKNVCPAYFDVKVAVDENQTHVFRLLFGVGDEIWMEMSSSNLKHLKMGCQFHDGEKGHERKKRKWGAESGESPSSETQNTDSQAND